MLLNSGPQSFIKLRVAFRVAISSEVRRENSRSNLQRTGSMRTSSSASSVSSAGGLTVRPASSTVSAITAATTAPPTAPTSPTTDTMAKLPVPTITTSASSTEVPPPFLRSKSLAPTDTATTTLPRIRISLQYRKRSDDLLVELLEAASLQALRDKAPPPKTKFFLSGTLFPTRQTYYSEEFNYSERLSLKGKFVFLLGRTDISTCILLLKVVCGSRMNQSPLGEANVSLQTYDLEPKLIKWYELSKPAAAPAISAHASINDVPPPNATSNNTLTSPLSAVT
ncbi:hypothetical protein RvY_18848 [Ramazzottius varieornatus]|uniref:Uncharacterized protein n=1 Tax=Ramazzottius varieornatus TaxID=947166 RepID=A0A1D1WBU4_RAMVA|nr:hypothetical protein RvY_18848 [Ramazzottius varieornatus]